MGQVRKQAVRQAILDSANRLFRKHGYLNTSVSQIAKAAGMSTSNIYVYFPSKLRVFFAVFDPWFRRQLESLEAEIEGVEDAPDRLRRILRAVWRDIPAADDGFANNLMQAMSTGSREEGYERDLLFWSEDKIADLIARTIPEAKLSAAELSYFCRLVFMAHDGFVMNHHMRGPSPRIDGVVEFAVSLLLDRTPRPAAREKPAPANQ